MHTKYNNKSPKAKMNLYSFMRRNKAWKNILNIKRTQQATNGWIAACAYKKVKYNIGKKNLWREQITPLVIY